MIDDGLIPLSLVAGRAGALQFVSQRRRLFKSPVAERPPQSPCASFRLVQTGPQRRLPISPQRANRLTEPFLKQQRLTGRGDIRMSRQRLPAIATQAVQPVPGAVQAGHRRRQRIHLRDRDQFRQELLRQRLTEALHITPQADIVAACAGVRQVVDRLGTTHRFSRHANNGRRRRSPMPPVVTMDVNRPIRLQRDPRQLSPRRLRNSIIANGDMNIPQALAPRADHIRPGAIDADHHAHPHGPQTPKRLPTSRRAPRPDARNRPPQIRQRIPGRSDLDRGFRCRSATERQEQAEHRQRHCQRSPNDRRKHPGQYQQRCPDQSNIFCVSADSSPNRLAATAIRGES